MLTSKELYELTHKWASDRGIAQNGRVYTQVLKLISEFGELCDAIIKDRPHEIKDALGDMCVVVSNIISIIGSQGDIDLFIEKFNEPLQQSLKIEQDIEKHKRFLISGICADCMDGLDIEIPSMLDIIPRMRHLANHYNFKLLECWESAYNEIKDRKGYLNEFGNFVKEGDV